MEQARDIVDSYNSMSSCKTALLIPFTIIVYYIQLGQKEAGGYQNTNACI